MTFSRGTFSCSCASHATCISHDFPSPFLHYFTNKLLFKMVEKKSTIIIFIFGKRNFILPNSTYAYHIQSIQKIIHFFLLCKNVSIFYVWVGYIFQDFANWYKHNWTKHALIMNTNKTISPSFQKKITSHVALYLIKSLQLITKSFSALILQKSN